MKRVREAGISPMRSAGFLLGLFPRFIAHALLHERVIAHLAGKGAFRLALASPGLFRGRAALLRRGAAPLFPLTGRSGRGAVLPPLFAAEALTPLCGKGYFVPLLRTDLRPVGRPVLKAGEPFVNFIRASARVLRAEKRAFRQREPRFLKDDVHRIVAGPVPEPFVPPFAPHMMTEGDVQRFMGQCGKQHLFRSRSGINGIAGQGAAVGPEIRARLIAAEAHAQRDGTEKRVFQNQCGAGLFQRLQRSLFPLPAGRSIPFPVHSRTSAWFCAQRAKACVSTSAGSRHTA